MPASNYLAHENFASHIMTFYGKNLKMRKQLEKEMELKKSQHNHLNHTPSAELELCNDSRHNLSDLRAEELEGCRILRNKD